MAEFSVDIAKFIEKAEGNLEQFLREFNQYLAEKVQENTPYITGTLRRGWTAAIGAPDTASQNGTGTIAAVLSGVKAGDIVYHTNNIKYGPYVEFGTSRMEARAFVRRTIAQAQGLANAVLQRLGK